MISDLKRLLGIDAEVMEGILFVKNSLILSPKVRYKVFGRIERIAKQHGYALRTVPFDKFIFRLVDNEVSELEQFHKLQELDETYNAFLAGTGRL